MCLTVRNDFVNGSICFPSHTPPVGKDTRYSNTIENLGDDDGESGVEDDDNGSSDESLSSSSTAEDISDCSADEKSVPVISSTCNNSLSGIQRDVFAEYRSTGHSVILLDESKSYNYFWRIHAASWLHFVGQCRRALYDLDQGTIESWSRSMPNLNDAHYLPLQPLDDMDLVVKCGVLF